MLFYKMWVSDEPYCAYAFESYGTVWPTESYCTVDHWVILYSVTIESCYTERPTESYCTVWSTESCCTLWPTESYCTICWVFIIQCFRFVVQVTDMSPPQNAHMSFGQTNSLFQWVLRAVSQGTKKPGTWRRRLPLSNADIKVRSFTSTPPRACIVLAVFFVWVADPMLEAVSVGVLWQWFVQQGAVRQSVSETDVDTVCCSWMFLYMTLWQVLWLLHPPLFPVCYSQFSSWTK